SHIRRLVVVSAGARDGVRARVGGAHLEQRGGRKPAARGHLGLPAGVPIHYGAGGARHPAPLVRSPAASPTGRAVRGIARRGRPGARDRTGADCAGRSADARDRRDGRQRGEPAPRRRPRRARGAVRARWTTPGVRRRLSPPSRGRNSASAKGQIPHLVPEPLAAALEAGRGALGRARNKGAVGGEIREAGDWSQRLKHLQRVRLPVGRKPQQAARGETAREKLGERALDEAALVVALLRPGVREEDEELIHRLRRDLPLEDLDRVMTYDAHVTELPLLEPEQQPADARTVDLDAEEITRRMSTGECEKILAVAEANLDAEGRLAPEQRSRLERLRRELDAVLRPQGLESTLLRHRDPTAAGYEGADRTRMLGAGHAGGGSYCAPGRAMLAIMV